MIIDAVTHAYNLLPENHSGGRVAFSLTDQMYLMHELLTPPEYLLPSSEVFKRDWSADELASILFVESDTDIAVHHVLALETLYHDGLCSYEKTLEAVTRYPDRFLAYAGVDPLTGPLALEELDRQVETLQPIGVKLYPASWLGRNMLHTGWRMDDPSIAFPIYERALEHGLHNVAVHKALPMGAVELDPYQVSDVAAAASAFPEINFEIVHGGMTFLEETAVYLGVYDNVYVNLEVAGALICNRERWFGQILAGLLSWGGWDKLFWGSGAVLTHPQPGLRKFRDEYQLPDDLANVAGTQLTPEIKDAILGGNYARVHGLDVDGMRARIADDEFSRARAAHDGTPWTGLEGVAR